MRLSYFCPKCGGQSFDSMNPCSRCGNYGSVIIAIDRSHISLVEIENYMLNAPKPWPLDKIFLPAPFDYLSLRQLRLVAESRKKGVTTYVLGE